MKKRMLSLLLCLCIVLSMIPAITVDAADPVTYVLDTTADLTGFSAGAKKDGDTEVVHDYFTIIYSVSSKVDSSNKTFEDEYTATQRINFGGKTEFVDGVATKNAIKFTTYGAATVKIWWVSGGDTRRMALYDSSANIVAEDGANSVKNALYISKFSVAAAGTYYIGVPDGSNYLFKVEVTECAHANTKSVDEVSANCGKAGTEAGVVCSDCGAVISGCAEIPATGVHTFDKENPTGKCTVCTADCTHSYTDGTCTICGMAKPAATVQTHNFTTEGKTDPDNFFSITGDTSTSKGSVTYKVNGENLTLTTCLKMESSTSIGFTAPAGTLTLVFGGSTSASGKAVKVDGTTYNADENGIVTVDLAEGAHTITKGDSINLFYMVYSCESSSTEEPSTCDHDYVVDENGYTWDGYTSCTVTGTCSSCGGTTTATAEITSVKSEGMTCETGGTITYTATFEETWAGTNQNVQTIEAGSPHTYDNGTCTTCGTVCENHTYENGICTNCGMAECTHSWDDGVVTTKATCQTTGVKTFTCSLCGGTKTEEVAIDANAHSWVDGETLIAPSCIAAGKKQQTCACGATQEVEIPAGHSYVEGVCAYHGTVLLDCTAVAGSKYIHNITADGMTDVDGFFTIAGEQDSTDLATVIYNGETLTSAIKMNTNLEISFTVPTNEAEGDDYDGIVILVGSESRTNSKGKFVITTLNIAVNDGTTTTNYKLAVPSDGIIMFAVTNGYTYTITKDDGENPLYYFEYVPGANLATVNDSETGGESGGEDDTTTGDGFVTFVAEIGGVQYLSLDAAVKAAKPGDTICLLKDTTETATIGDVLAVGESITIHLHGFTTGTITPDEGCTSTSSKNADDGTDVITITRTTAVEPADPTEGYVAYIDKDGDMEYSDGDDLYDDLSDVLALAGEKAKNGETVYVGLVNNTTETYVIIPVGVTLDLEEYTLTADYVVGFNGSYITADRYGNANYGKLSVAKDHVVLQNAFVASFEVLPLWDETQACYVFVMLSVMPDSNWTVGEHPETQEPMVKLLFQPICGNAIKDDYLKDATKLENSGLTFVVRLEWTVAVDEGESEQGTAYQDFVYDPVLAASIVTNGQNFSFVMANYEELGIDISTLSVTAMVVSETGVVGVGTTHSNNAG